MDGHASLRTYRYRHETKLSTDDRFHSIKAETDDLRSTPSVTLVEKLQDAGALVLAIDPHFDRSSWAVYPQNLPYRL